MKFQCWHMTTDVYPEGAFGDEEERHPKPGVVVTEGATTRLDLTVPRPVLIYRSKDGLGVRVPDAAFRVDDRPCSDRAALPLPAVVTADTFTFAVEPVGPRL